MDIIQVLCREQQQKSVHILCSMANDIIPKKLLLNLHIVLKHASTFHIPFVFSQIIQDTIRI